MRRLILIIAMVLLGAPLSFAQNGHDLFQKALQKERAEGNLEAAIALYARIVEEHASDRALVAKALLQMGQDYERLGRNEEAQRVFATVASEYVDQAEAARQAQARMAVVVVKAEEDSVIVVRHVWTEEPDGNWITIQSDIAPDGHAIAFTHWDNGSLLLRDLTDGSKRQLTEPLWPLGSAESAWAPVFSPDGKAIVYSWWNSEDFGELRTIGLDGSEPRVLYRNEELVNVRPFDWSKDGRHILALFNRDDRTNQIALIAVADTSVQVLKSLDSRMPERISFSPDGRYIVYDFPPDEHKPERDIFVLAIDGSAEHRLVAHPANDRWPIWSPDGNHIIFFSNRKGSYSAWVVPVEAGKARSTAHLVKRGMDDTYPLGFVDMGAFYFTVRTDTPDRFLAKIDWDTGKLTSAPTLVDLLSSYSTWSPDGRFVAYVPESHRATIIIRSTETGQERTLLPDLDWMAYRIHWSPDGQTFLVNGSDSKNGPGIFTIDIVAGDVTPVLYENTMIKNPIWSKDGKSIYFERYNSQDNTSEIVGRDLETGREQVYHRPEKENGLFPDFQLSPDGRWLAFRSGDASTPQEWPLMVVPTGGGEAREVLRTDHYRIHTWTPDGNGIVYLKWVGEESDLWQVSVEDGESRKIETGLEHVRALRLHPNGEHVVIYVYEDSAEVWMMEGFLPEDGGTK